MQVFFHHSAGLVLEHHNSCARMDRGVSLNNWRKTLFSTSTGHSLRDMMLVMPLSLSAGSSFE